MGAGGPMIVDPTAFDSPPHDDYWPTAFLLNGEWVDSVTDSWTEVGDSEYRARRSGEVLAMRTAADATEHTYSLTAGRYPDPQIPIYIAERTI